VKPHIANLTIKTAFRSLYPIFKHGAVCESGGRILAASPNIKKTGTPQASTSSHAEIAALKRLITRGHRNRSSETNLYVARVTPGNNLGLSKPCPHCMAAIKKSGIVKAIYYSLSDGNWAKIVVK
jgi:tRNA(Arg) A34 adenosine deaminase TadA